MCSDPSVEFIARKLKILICGIAFGLTQRVVIICPKPYGNELYILRIDHAAGVVRRSRLDPVDIFLPLMIDLNAISLRHL